MLRLPIVKGVTAMRHTSVSTVVLVFGLLAAAGANAELSGTLVIANKSGDSISFVDLALEREVARVPVGRAPHEVAISPDRKAVLVGEYGPDDAHGGTVAVIEIHRTPGPQRTLLTVDEAYAASTAVAIDGGRFRVMAPTHRLIHFLFHGQVQDFHYWFARPQFRMLLDIARLMETRQDEIDWAQVVRRFRGQGYGQVVGGTAALLEAWFGVSPPAAVPIGARDWRYVTKCEAGLDRAEGETGFWLRWIGWASVNLMPKRLAYRHRLEGEGWPRRLAVVRYRQGAFVVKMATWPYRNYRRRHQARG